VTMEIGIGIPNSVVGTTGAQLLDWARRAEQAGFSSLGTIGAVSYPSYEELTVFAAAGAVTERIRFLSNVLIAPARSAAELAKQAATVQQITNGRLTLGLGVGWRESDYLLTGRDFHKRGRDFDAQLADLQRAWQGQPFMDGTRPPAPDPGPAGVPLLFGGRSEAAVRRMVEYGIGWTAGGAPPEALPQFIEKVRKAWRDARDGKPRLVGLRYFSLGDTETESRNSMLDYYKVQGREAAERIAGNALRSPEAIREAVKRYSEIGLDELILDPTVSDPSQVDLLADVVL
jgi:alkanesulfonate monooxygenase SsuD/methylene tetrahydromethanopterin reductase-like flavin-dependent oxidoreductase (luciferase family)